MVMSAVSSVSTPGVLVTMMPRSRAVSRSILSTPVPKLAISFSCGPACESRERSIRSVTVGTSTSAVFTASASSAWLIGLSSTLSRASNSSRMRVSTASGQLARDDDERLFLRCRHGERALCRLAGSRPGAFLPRGRLAPCLTDAHSYDKIRLTPPSAAARAGLILTDKSCSGLANERAALHRPCARGGAPTGVGVRAGARAGCIVRPPILWRKGRPRRRKPPADRRFRASSA